MTNTNTSFRLTSGRTHLGSSLLLRQRGGLDLPLNVLGQFHRSSQCKVASGGARPGVPLWIGAASSTLIAISLAL